MMNTFQFTRTTKLCLALSEIHEKKAETSSRTSKIEPGLQFRQVLVAA